VAEEPCSRPHIINYLTTTTIQVQKSHSFCRTKPGNIFGLRPRLGFWPIGTSWERWCSKNRRRKHPNKEDRKQLYNYKRKLNTKENRKYENGSYVSKLVCPRRSVPTKEVRMFIVSRRDAKTLIRIIVKNVKSGNYLII
jgi:hypothetical protein